MRNVAIIGGFAAGKSTIAEGLVRAGFTQVSFAAPFKALAAHVYNEGKPVDKAASYLITDDDGWVRSISGRQLLQMFGQSVKEMDRDFWVKLLLRDIETGKHGVGPFVLDDCRFAFEAAALGNAGWLIVKVETPVEVRMARYEALYGRLPTPSELTHPSETEVDDIIADIYLDGTADPAKSVAWVRELAATGIAEAA